METTTFDVAIIGGGAAGLSAALVLGRARRTVAVIDAGSPRNAPADHMHGFISRDGMAPAELLAAARAELRTYGVEIVPEEVTAIEGGFALQLARGDRLTARRLLIASGAVDELPDIPGARERWGRDFLHCPYCHGWEVRDQPIGVLGSDAGSVEHAHLLRQWSEDVAFFTHTHQIQDAEREALRARGVVVIDGQVARLSVLDDQLHAVELVDGRRVERAAVFMRPTLHASSRDLIESLGCQTEQGGFVRVDTTGKSSTAGIWAVGNAANPRAQVITAAGEGSTAAIAINADLVQEDVRNALETSTEKESA